MGNICMNINAIEESSKENLPQVGLILESSNSIKKECEEQLSVSESF